MKFSSNFFFKRNVGRNRGVITVRHLGAGNKLKYRLLNHYAGSSQLSNELIYRRNESHRRDGSLLIASTQSGFFLNSKLGVIAPSVNLFALPNGTVLKSVSPNGKHSFIASAYGSCAILRKLYLEKETQAVVSVGIKMPSGSFRLVTDPLSRASVVATDEKIESPLLSNRKYYELAGINRRRGIRPWVRGVAMNPVDHPHGGGEGKTSGGRISVSAWGVKTKGYRTNRKLSHKRARALRKNI
jgi:large subunit ribosomal protein L2